MKNKDIHWNVEKNKELKSERDISFEEVRALILTDSIKSIIQNPSKNHLDQKALVIEAKGYIYYVPFVEDEKQVFLKTIVPSRILKKKYEQQDKRKSEGQNEKTKT